MKKLNPLTGQFYKRGDLSLDGKKRFWGYKTAHLNKDGFYSNAWKAAENYNRFSTEYNATQRQRNKQNKASDFPKRMNPKTGAPFVMGDKRPDGFTFVSYSSNGKMAGGYRGEVWMAPAPYFRHRVGLSLGKIKKRAEEKGITCDLDIDYLLEIFPADKLCPILNFEMEFGGDRNRSPSVDRLKPGKGYVKGNVAWVSKLANTAKSDLTSKQLRMIADWIESQPIWQGNQRLKD